MFTRPSSYITEIHTASASQASKTKGHGCLLRLPIQRRKPMYRVLLVDDEKIARIGLRTTFDWERHGFTLVGEASNGQNAMKWIQNQEIDILITDIAMPVMDGLELTRKTKELCPWVK